MLACNPSDISFEFRCRIVQVALGNHIVTFKYRARLPSADPHDYSFGHTSTYQVPGAGSPEIVKDKLRLVGFRIPHFGASATTRSARPVRSPHPIGLHCARVLASARLGTYVQRWEGWARAGLGNRMVNIRPMLGVWQREPYGATILKGAPAF